MDGDTRRVAMAIDTNRIKDHLRKLRKIINKIPRKPTPAEIHRLRTRVRRFEIELQASGLDAQLKEKWLRKQLARIRRRAGKVRDMDVLTAHLSTVRVEGERDCLIQLFEYLGTKRYGKAERVHQAVHKHRGAMGKRLKKIARVLKKRVEESSTAEAATSAALRSSAELGTHGNLNRGNLHEYRLKLKELRCILQMGEETKNAEFVKALGQIKDAIGEWHDWEELNSIAAKILDHSAGCKLQHQLKEIAQQKYETALSSASKLHKTYFRPPSESKGHTNLNGQKASRAVSAVSALAGG
jgi:CHAD domain-containing protein